MLKFSAWLACVTGIVLAGWAAALNWTSRGPEFARDLYYTVVSPDLTSAALIAAVLLFWGGVTTLRQRRRGPAILAGGWGFALCMACLASEPINWFVSSEYYAVGVSASFKTYLVAVAVLMVIAVIGLSLAVLGVRREE